MKETAQHRFESMTQWRSVALRRAIDNSALTLPTLIPESDQADPLSPTWNNIPSLYQGVGARGVNSLAARLLLSLYPPAVPFFRLTMDASKIRDYAAANGGQEEDITSKLDQVLSSMERQMLRRLDQVQARSAVFEALKHLIVGGNALLYCSPENIRMYGLRSYCVDRDPEGNVVEICLREQVSKKFVPGKAETNDAEPNADVYTHVSIDPDNDRVEWFQEHEGKKLPNSQGFSRLDNSPWLVLRWGRVAGEPYGRGLVESMINDLQALESLSQAIVEGSLIMAKAVGLVNPNGTTRADVLAKAKNGAIVAGNAADVEFLQVQKSNDFSVALQTMQMIERRLSFSFLLNEAVQRDAERVTAEEIRLMAEQLEQGLGGVYTVLAEELQLPLIRRIMFLMERDGELPPVPKGLVEPQITTGLEAIGRGNDKQRLTEFLSTIATALGPDQFLSYINPTELIRRFAAADGIDTAGLVRSEEELQAEQAQAEQAMLAQSLTQGAISNGSTNPPQIPAGAAPAAGATPAPVPGG